MEQQHKRDDNTHDDAAELDELVPALEIADVAEGQPAPERGGHEYADQQDEQAADANQQIA
jgi:hypothetical protein